MGGMRIGRILFYTFSLSIPLSGWGIETPVVFLSLPNILLIASFAALVTGAIRQRSLELSMPKLLFSLLATTFLVFAILRNMTAPMSGSPSGVITRWGAILVVYATVLAIQERNHLYLTLIALSIGGVLVSVLGVLSGMQLIPATATIDPSRTLFWIDLPVRRTLGAPMGYGTYGVIACVSLATLITYWLHTPDRWQRRGFAGAAGIVLGGVFVSQSRSTFLAVGATTFVYIGMSNTLDYLNQHPLVRQSTKWAAVGTILSLPFVARQLIGAAPSSVFHRVRQIEWSVEAFSRKPLVGVGRFGYLELTNASLIHNSFFHVLPTLGIVGAGLFVAIWGLALQTLVRWTVVGNAGHLGPLLLAAFAGLAVENTFYVGGYAKVTWLLLSIFISIPVATNRDSANGV